MDTFFPSTYEDSRARFIKSLSLIQKNWHATQLEARPLNDHPDLTIDWLWAHARSKKTLVILSTAEHGIEGYVGAAMMKIFIDEFAPRLNPENTGLLLVHGLNPWGMNHHRKVNEHNVDLNRNFVFDGNFDPAINPEFHRVESFINPQRQFGSLTLEKIRFWGNVIKNIITTGIPTITTAALLGQHHTPNGFYYGGTEYQGSTSVMMGLLRKALEDYKSIVHLDLHTGYGPRYQMSVLLSPLDPHSSEEFARRINYPLVLKIDPKEFYAISGDICAYFYRLRNIEFPNKELFSGGFEFGTFGDSLPARIRSLRAMVFENQLHWHGARNAQTAERVRREFDEFYFPSEPKWREKALADGRQAFEGILQAYQLIS